jgi:hypothetical protein
MRTAVTGTLPIAGSASAQDQFEVDGGAGLLEPARAPAGGG